MKIEGHTEFGRVTVDLNPSSTPFQLMLIGAVTALLEAVEGDESSIRIDGQAMEMRENVNLHSFEILWQDILDFSPKTPVERGAVNAAEPFIEEMLEGLRDGQAAARDSARSASTRPDNVRPRQVRDGSVMGAELANVKIGGVRALVDSVIPPHMNPGRLYEEALRDGSPGEPPDGFGNNTAGGDEAPSGAPPDDDGQPAVVRGAVKREGVRRLGEPRPAPPEAPVRVKRFPGQALQRTRVKGAVRRLSR